MNILFLVYRYPDEKNNSTLEKDLVRIFNEKGHSCFAVSITEKKYGKNTYLFDDNGIKVLKVKTGDLFGVNKIKKGLTVMTMPKLLGKETFKKFGTTKIDLIVAYTPFMANPKLVNNLKKHFACGSLMMMWDIFPQNAKDLGLIKNKYVFNYFKYKDLHRIDSEDIEEYKSFLLYEAKLNVKSVNRKLVAINQFFKYSKIAVSIRQEKIQTQNFLDDMLEDEDIESMLKVIDEHKDLRAKAIVMTMKLTGMRVSEMLQLTIDDIDKDTINIIGKGNKRRNVFISEHLKEIWKEYVNVRINKTNMLFTGQKGAINRYTVHKIIKYYAQLSNVKLSKAHAHNFRHKFCKDLADRGVSIDSIADIVGHTDINTTRIYTRKTKKELLDIINKM